MTSYRHKKSYQLSAISQMEGEDSTRRATQKQGIGCQ